MIVWGGARNPDVRDGIARFVGERVDGGLRGFGDCTTMGVIHGETLIAGVVYHNYSPEAGTIEISGAATDKRWLTRPVLKAMFDYPFNQIGCQMVVARHSEQDTPLRRMWVAVGAVEYVIPRLRGRDKAEAIALLTDDVWRSSKKIQGREI